MQTLNGTAFHALSASDALRGSGYFLKGKRHRAGFLTGHTGNTLLLFPLNPNKAETVKPPIDCTKGAQILTKRTVHFDRQNNDKQQDAQFPEKQPSYLAKQRLVCGKQRNRPKQRARRAQIFTKCGNLCKSPKEKQRSGARQKK